MFCTKKLEMVIVLYTWRTIDLFADIVHKVCLLYIINTKQHLYYDWEFKRPINLVSV